MADENTKNQSVPSLAATPGSDFHIPVPQTNATGKISQPRGDEKDFVTTHAVETNNPGANNYVTVYHDHDGVNTPPVREQHIYRRRQRIEITLPNTDPATAANWGAVFMATDPCRVRAVYEFHSTAGSDGSAVTMQVQKLTAGVAPGSGTDILATGINLKGTANTMQKGTFVPARASRTLAYGERLGIKPTGTLTSLAGVLIIIEVEFI